MPPPGTYIDITALPQSDTVPQADFNAGTFGGVANECWYRFVTAVDVIIGLHIDEGGTFQPNVRLFANDGTTLIVNAGTRKTVWVLLSPDTYYYQVRNGNGFGSSDFDFTSDFEQGAFVSTPITAGSYVINDDSAIAGSDPFSGDAYPATVFAADGTFLGFARDVAAGEIGAGLMSGESLWHDRFGTVGASDTLALYDADLALIAGGISIGALGGIFPLICSNGTKFYALNRNTLDLYTIDTAGAVTGPIDTLPDFPFAMGVNNAGTILYTAHGTDDGDIGQWDLVGHAALPDLYTVPGFTTGDNVGLTALNVHPGEILVLSDDSLCVVFFDDSATTYHLLHLDSGGTLIDDISYMGAGPTGVGIDHISYSLSDPTHIRIWLFTDGVSGNEGRFAELELSSGTLSNQFDSDLFSAGVSLITSGTQIFGPSASCTMVTLRSAAPPSDGTITVIKATVPPADPQSFDFTAGGGLSPGSFSLVDGGSQVYDPVTAGSGYSIIETPVDGWVTTYTVSNDPSNDNTNITVGAGEDVTVTVTNTFVGSGTLRVIKVTSPSPDPTTTTFDIAVGGGLTPDTLALQNGDSHLYDPVTAGTYSVVETPVPGWSTSYSVSNGSPNIAVTVADGEDVTVTITNTLLPPAGGNERRYQIRRLLQTPHISNENRWLFFHKFQLDLEVGQRDP